MESHSKLNKNNLATPIAIIIAGLIIGGAIYLTNNQKPTSVAAVAQPSRQKPSVVPVDITKVKTTGDAFIGNPNAPVTVAFWYDYQCPFCKRFEVDAMSQLVTDYLKTGKVKVVFKDFQFLGPDSQTTALIARAVWEVDPTNFYKWHSTIYQNQGQEGSGWATQDKILAMTTNILGASEEKQIEGLIVSKKTQYQSAIDADKAEGGSFGISGTPGAIIGTNLISGAQPYSAVKQLIDIELKGK
jgi:protein-disulfide isomerase